MKISDAIIEWCDEVDVDGGACDEMRELADRIDREMVELPKDADGMPIRIGDVVYGNPGVAWKVVGLRMSKFGWKVEIDNVPFPCKPDDLTHKNPRPDDSWERIADELEGAEKWCDHDGRYATGIVSVSVPKLREWSDRIRKLAGIEEEAQR